MHECVHELLHVWVCVHVYVHACLSVHTYVHVHIDTCMHVLSVSLLPTLPVSFPPVPSHKVRVPAEAVPVVLRAVVPSLVDASLCLRPYRAVLSGS